MLDEVSDDKVAPTKNKRGGSTMSGTIYARRKQADAHRRHPVGGGMRAVAYALLWMCIVLPLWIISLIVEAHFEYIPPVWLRYWAFYLPWVGIVINEVRCARRVK